MFPTVGIAYIGKIQPADNYPQSYSLDLNHIGPNSIFLSAWVLASASIMASFFKCLILDHGHRPIACGGDRGACSCPLWNRGFRQGGSERGGGGVRTAHSASHTEGEIPPSPLLAKKIKIYFIFCCHFN